MFGRLTEKGAFKLLRNNRITGLHWFFQNYFAKMSYFALAMVGVRQHAEEIATQVFANLWNKRHSIKSSDEINTFLYYEARDECYQFLKNNRYERIDKTHRYWNKELPRLLDIMQVLEKKRKKSVMKNIFTIELKNEYIYFGRPTTNLFDPKYNIIKQQEKKHNKPVPKNNKNFQHG